VADRLGDAGGQPQKPVKYAPIFVAASLTGLYSQRHVFHDPSNVVTQRFYGGRPDTLWDGLNIELSNELTLIRRFGCSEFSSVTYPQAPDAAFSFELDDGSIQVLIDTPSFVYLDNQNGTKTTIFTKGSGAGQGYFVASGNTVYYGDGVDTLKYTPGNPNGLVWNWAITAPSAPPAITTISSGSAAVAWAASKWYSTMGCIIDANSNVQILVSVNADGTNPSSPYGLAGNGQPAWNQTPGDTTSDGSITWTNFGQIEEWQPSHNYAPGAPIYDPDTNAIYIQSRNSTFPSGAVKPNFIPTPAVGSNAGVRTWETSPGTAKWMCLGVVGSPTTSMIGLWLPSTAFNELYQPATGTVPGVGYDGFFNSAVVEPTLTMPPSSQPQFLQACDPTGGTTDSSYTSPNWQTSAGQTTQDGQCSWMCLGSDTWAATTDYTQWAGSGSVFSALQDTNGNLQICVQAGRSGSTQPSSGGGQNNYWGTYYGAQTQDGTVVWVCVGPATSWPGASVSCYLPAVGFSPPQSSNPFGGAEVIGSNFVQNVISTGISQTPGPPSWSTTIGSTTTDSGVTWSCVSAYSANSLAWTAGYTYAFSFASRLASDSYNTTAPPGWAAALGTPTGALTGGISTASPIFVISGANPGAVNVLTGLGSTDPQVDTIIIWRSPDEASGADDMLFLTEIPNPVPVNGAAQPWTFNDFLPDVATSVYPGLNALLPAPIDDSNDPPPPGFRPLCNKLHFSRIFGAVGNTVYFTGGPDVLTGNPNECFNPVDEFPFESTVIACIHTPSGLICPTTTDFECIYGGPSTASFYDTTMLPGVGMLSYNAWDIYGGELYFVSADSQFWSLNPATQLARLGFPIGNLLATFDAASCYVTVHEYGTDNAIYVGDGSTGWFRLNPHQVGADMSGENVSVWSPKAAIVGGCQMLLSVVTAPGITELLIGGTSTNQNILKRDQTVFSDNGSAYSAWFDIGAITMVYPGQRAAVKFIEMDFMQVGTQPLVSYVLDDPTPSPSWNSLTNYVFDPPIVYAGTQITPTYWPDRFYLSQNADVAVGRRIRMKTDFGNTDTVRNELISFSIWGRKYSE
jgi:hypothetical protein